MCIDKSGESSFHKMKQVSEYISMNKKSIIDSATQNTLLH